MKTKSLLTIATISLFACISAKSATILPTNYAGADSSVIVNLSNNAIANGFAAVGYFNVDDVDISTLNSTDLASAFQIFGASSTTTVEKDFGSPFFMDGIVEFGASSPILSGSPFIGQNIYLVVGNAATLGASTEAFIYKTNILFLEDPAQPGETLDFTAGAPSGTLIMGLTGITATPFFYQGVDTFPGNEINTAYQTAAIIPEPSVALLGAFGILALLRRRR